MKKLFLIAMLLPIGVFAQNIKLSNPTKTGGKPLMEALMDRQTSRSFTEQALSNETLSNLLWAAWGYNREDKRTAPSALNRQSIELYVATAQGIYLYDARANELQLKVKGDYRKQTGMQPFVGTAFMELIYICKTVSEHYNMLYADCGFIAQNVYLYCASEGLGTVVRGSVPQEKLAKIMGISDPKRILLAQTVGYIKK